MKIKQYVFKVKLKMIWSDKSTEAHTYILFYCTGVTYIGIGSSKRHFKSASSVIVAKALKRIAARSRT